MKSKTSKAGQSPDKATPVAKKSTINVKKLLRKFIAKPLAYITLFILAAYGMHMVLKTLNGSASTVLTVLAILALCYILFDEA